MPFESRGAILGATMSLTHFLDLLKRLAPFAFVGLMATLFAYYIGDRIIAWLASRKIKQLEALSKELDKRFEVLQARKRDLEAKHEELQENSRFREELEVNRKQLENLRQRFSNLQRPLWEYVGNVDLP